MKKFIAIAISLILMFSATSCVTSKGQGGALIGAGAGALAGQAIGRNTTSTLIGTALGGMLGYIIGNEMDKYDRQRVSHVYETSPSHQTTAWVNPDTGNRYEVTPQPAYKNSRGQVCREAIMHAKVRGKYEEVYTTACRDGNGDWVLQN
jgi:surface antigen